ncbi:hypothetical protein [Listeria seeligeri]|uniref:hypothetical protein n=1 Tax=Listeria seeligeri TaxID=1640 RepID=UPI0022EBB792|nr:hypothetical protein [Listeria seeligeri]
MDMVLIICISDGTSIVIDGFDIVSMYTSIPGVEVEHSGYTWRENYYYDLLNYLNEYKYIGVKRNNCNEELKYRNHDYTYQDGDFKHNTPLFLKTSNIITIIDMYD